MLCPRPGFSDVQEMCHKVGLENTSKNLAILVAEVGILASLVMWMDHNSFEVQDHKVYLYSATCLQVFI